MRIGKISLILLASATIMMCVPVGYFILPSAKDVSIVEDQYKSHKGITAYLINLERSKERLSFVKPRIDKLNLPLQRIEAVDGYKLSSEEFAKNVDLESYHNFLGQSPKVGIIGCSLSHIKAWQEFLNSNYEFAIIFEDDISFNPEEVSTTINELIANRQYWDIANLETHHRGLPVTIKKLDNGSKMVSYLVEVTHAGAYLINRHAAKQLVSKALPIKMPIDHYFTRGWELNLKFVGIEPRIVKQTFGDSTIETSKRNNEEYQTNLKQKIIKRVYKIQTNTIRFVYNLWNIVCDWQK